jgi:formate dehydrogenase subunit gamma
MSLVAILHAIQDENGYVPPAVVAPLAKAMNLSRAEVHGVITYYHHFRQQAPAAVTVQLCRAEACRSMGTEALAQHIESHTGCKFDAHRHGTGGDHAQGPVGLESVYCLGQCSLSPAMMINDELHARVTPQKFDALLAAALKEVEATA